MNYFMTLLMAFIGGYIFKKLNIPVGAMLGSLAFVTIYQVTTNDAIMISQAKYILQILSGILIGNKITLQVIQNLKHLWKPYLCLMIIIISVLCFMSTLLFHLTNIDITTALFALAPGGATDLTILSSEYNANMSYVALIHTVRKLMIMVIVPFIARTMCKKEEHIQLNKTTSKNHIFQFIGACLLASVVGILFKVLNIKSGVMIGAIIGAAIYKLGIHDFTCPKELTFILQILTGAFVGVTINQELIAQLSTLWIAVIIVAIETLFIILFNAFAMNKFFKMSKLTSILCSAPGALSDITILSEELGGDLPTIATLQILRMFSIIMIIPYLATFMSYL